MPFDLALASIEQIETTSATYDSCIVPEKLYISQRGVSPKDTDVKDWINETDAFA